tara:strand:+ start:965 stop:1456 length:492 start_codon:yes stop_codon:yes gene_type:complete
MNYLKVAIGVIIALSASRFIPHPPNFTSLIALSFYIPAIFGIRYIPIIVLTLLFTDLFIGFHSTMIFTFGSVVVIGLISNYFNRSIIYRISGCLIGAAIFFLISNFGVWTLGSYGYSINGLTACYIAALPFFGYTALSALIYSAIIEIIYKIFKIKQKIINNF